MAAAEAAVERERMEYDVVVVGAGPGGLATAIRLKQLAAESGRDVSVCVLEKGSEVGAHILSGAVLEPHALDELIPDWQAQGAPVTTPVREEKFLVLGPAGVVTLPNFILPPALKNHGNWVISLGNLCRWLGQQAEALGVEIYPGFPAADLILAEDGRILGVVTGDMGVGRDGEPGPNYQPGMELRATYTVFAEGCRGSLGKRLMRHFGLREGADPQTYGIGLKELWEVDPAQHRPGLVVHSVGWPLGNDTYGGSFLYHLDNNQVAVGFVVGLDYSNPHLAPFEEFQRFKTHPAIRPTFVGGRRISYGARALNEGGLQSLPKLTFPGGLLVGCEAGTLVVPKIKGTHTAMKSGMVAAETLFAALGESAPPAEPAAYGGALRRSWVWKDLHVARNFRPSFRWGLVAGTLLAGLDQVVLRGRAPWTLHHRHADHETLVDKRRARRIAYPKPDGVVTFDRLSSVFISNTNHEEDQPVHLRLADERIPVEVNLARWDAPEQRYCPAGVYEIVEEGGQARLQINAQNCVHCKTCDIKDPTQNINWVTPEGGGGPNYPNM